MVSNPVPVQQPMQSRVLGTNSATRAAERMKERAPVLDASERRAPERGPTGAKSTGEFRVIICDGGLEEKSRRVWARRRGMGSWRGMAFQAWQQHVRGL